MDLQHITVQDENNLKAKAEVKRSQIPVRRGVLSNVTNTKLAQPQGKPVVKERLVSEPQQPRTIKRPASSNNIPVEQYGQTTNYHQHKRSKTLEYEWQDLDEEDWNDPLMASEYVVEIFEYFHQLEVKTLPSRDYLSKQTYINSNMRDQLVDWMCEVHTKFRLLPETLFVAINLMDRFLSREVVQVNRLQLLGTASMFIASKYEEIYSPSVNNFSNESGSTVEEILAAEKFILEILEFDLSYPNPMNFLRRISKADDYDVNTRTIGKYFLEVSIMDHRFIGIKPSLCAAASMYLSRKMMGKEEWDGNLIHYSGGYFESELEPVVQLYLHYLVSPVIHEEFFKKYASKRFMKASIIARQWAKNLVRASSSEL